MTRYLLTVTLAFVCMDVSHADTITVCASGCDHSTIQTAIEAASDGDIIEIQSETFASPGAIIDKSITLKGQVDFEGQPTTLVTMTGAFRVPGAVPAIRLESMRFSGSSNVLTTGFVKKPQHVEIINCHFDQIAVVPGSGEPGTGGGVLAISSQSATIWRCRFENCVVQESPVVDLKSQSTIEIRESTFTGNQGFAYTSTGAALGVYGSSLLIDDCSFTDNQITAQKPDYARGAAIYLGGSALSTATITDTTFSRNVATGIEGQGGAIYFDGDEAGVADPLLFENCTFTENRAAFGGAIAAKRRCDLELRGCIASENSGLVAGGAILARAQGTAISIMNSLLQENAAPLGGAIAIETTASLHTADSTFLGNLADDGGAIHADSLSSLRVDATRLEQNQAQRGGAIYVDNQISSPERIVLNSSISNNQAGVSGGGIHTQSSATRLGLMNNVLCGNTDDQIFGPFEDLGDNAITDTCADETDSDGDGVPDDIDGCPADPAKTEPGRCGCGVVDTDLRGDFNCDGVYDQSDYVAMQTDLGICPGDLDGNGRVDGADLGLLFIVWGNCP